MISIIKHDALTMDGLWENVAENKKILKSKVDYLFRAGYWRNQIQIPAILKIYINKYEILLVTHGDQPTNQKRLKFLPKKIKIFANNIPVKEQNNLLIAIPIGLTNNTDESEFHRLFGDKQMLIEAMKQDKTSDYFIYCNFNKANHKSREDILEVIRENPRIYFEETKYTKNGRQKFLANIRRSRFVICPRGNGIDTHRLWETLYLGSVPIVLKQDLPIVDLEKKLPIVVIDSIRDINNTDKLNSIYANLQHKNFNYNLLRLSYWTQRIFSSIDI